MSQGVTNRYLGMAKGAVVATGNTFGLDKASYNTAAADLYTPGNIGSAGVFLTLDNTSIFPSGWSTIYNNNQTPSSVGIIRASQVTSTLRIGSSARLNIPTTAKKILHAELIWFANINTAAGVNPEATIIFNHPNPQVPTSIVADSIGPNLFKVRYDLTAQEIDETWRIYVRSADVTRFIAIGDYTYSVVGVSASIRGGSDLSNTAGWSLIVAYADDTMDYNNLSIYVMCAPVGAGTSVVEIAIPNIITPGSGALKGKAVMITAEGDVRYTGDYATFGAARNPTTRLSIGNHLADNFFIGEVSIADNDPDIGGPTVMGSIDTRGSMGRNNHNSQNTVNGARQGIDITRVDISNTLSYNQSSAYMNFGTVGDTYIPVGFGTQIMVNTSLQKARNLAIADIGDTIIYTTTVINGGSNVPWSNVWFKDPIPPGTEFVPGSVEVFYNNVKQTGFTLADPEIGFALKTTLSRTDNVVVRFQVIVRNLALINNAMILNESTVTYILTDSSGVQYTVNETSNQVSTIVQHAELVLLKDNNPNTVVTCTNIVQYTIRIQNIGSVNATVPIGSFQDPCPAGSQFVGAITSSSNQSGYDNTSIQFNANRTAFTNTKILTIRPYEIITILVNVTPIC